MQLLLEEHSRNLEFELIYQCLPGMGKASPPPAVSSQVCAWESVQGASQGFAQTPAAQPSTAVWAEAERA